MSTIYHHLRLHDRDLENYPYLQYTDKYTESEITQAGVRFAKYNDKLYIVPENFSKPIDSHVLHWGMMSKIIDQVREGVTDFDEAFYNLFINECQYGHYINKFTLEEDKLTRKFEVMPIQTAFMRFKLWYKEQWYPRDWQTVYYYDDLKGNFEAWKLKLSE